MNSFGQIYLVNWFSGQKVEYPLIELELAANRAEPENQAELVPGPDPDKIKIKDTFLPKIKCAKAAPG